MNASIVISSALSGCEKIISTLLVQDNAALEKVRALSGKILQVHCEQPTLSLYIQFVDDQLFLLQGVAKGADCSLQGKAASLLKLLVTRNSASMHSEGIKVTGNTGVLSGTQEILEDLDIDWEYQLSHVIGDIPTQLLADGIDLTRRFFKRASASVREDVSHFLVTEKKLFPEKNDLESFCSDVDALRLRVDRLSGRIDRMQSQTAE